MSTTHLDRARDLRRLIDKHAGDGDVIADAVVEALYEAELYGTMIPRDAGGLELSVMDNLEVFAEVSRADGSTGWCLMASTAAAAYFGAFCDQDHVDRMFGGGVPKAAGQFAPNGTARKSNGGYVLNGKYNFGSGIAHAEWVGAGVLTEVAEGENPDYLFTIFPVGDARVTGNWNVMGLTSTASYDYTVADVEVPANATFNLFDVTRYRGGPMYELGVMGLTAAGHAGFAVGVVRRALDELRSIAKTKVRMGAPAMATSERFLHELGQLESRYEAAAGWVRSSFAEAEAKAIRDGVSEPADVNRCKAATSFMTHEGADIVRQAYLLAGTQALRDGALQRCFRDIHAGTQHALASVRALHDYGTDTMAAAAADPLDAD